MLVNKVKLYIKKTETASLEGAGMEQDKCLWRQSYACPAKTLECMSGTLVPHTQWPEASGSNVVAGQPNKIINTIYCF
jgi:hypothetical protein